MTSETRFTVELARLPELALEREFRARSSDARWLLCGSDVEALRLDELLALTDDECRGLWDELALGYTAPSGHPLLRAEIAGLYERLGAEQVLTCAGADEALFLTLNAILRPGDHAVIAWPGYESLFQVARAAGAEVTPLRLRHDTGWRLDLRDLRRALRPETRLIVVNYPHNPTGALPDRSTFEGMVALAAEVGAVLLSDEVYRLLEHDPADRLPAGVDAGRHVVSVGVMSKSFGLAGLRIGWIATRDEELLERVTALKDYTSGCNSAPSEILALAALRARDAVLGRSRALVAGNLAELDAFFEEWEGVFEWVRPRAGCVGFPRLVTGGPLEPFLAGLLDEEGVLLVPGSVYEHGGNHFRLGFGRADMPGALARLDRFARRSLRA